MKRYILALDQGTTSSRAVVVDPLGRIVARAQRPFRQLYPEAGWVEHDANEIWETQLWAAQEAIRESGVGPEAIAGIGIANQRETVVVWDRSTGEPIAPAIVWQCRRTAPMCAQLKERGLSDLIRRKTGLVIDPYFSGTKIAWILEHVPGAAERAARGELLAGTIDTWLIWKLTGGAVHATDPSNASRTMLCDIHSLTWDDELLRELAVPKSLLPEVRDSSGWLGETDARLLGAAIPIGGVAGDQQAALFGQACFRPGMAKATYGTGAFLLMQTGPQPVSSQSGLLTTIAWRIKGQTMYALEGSVFVAGAVVQWLRDELGLIADAAETEELAREVTDTSGIYVVPAFVGLGAPYWDERARGAIVGLTRGANRKHIVRAALEAIAYQVQEVLAAMEEDAALPLGEVRVDGGAARNDFLMQFQADLVRRPIRRAQESESTALGAAYLAGLAVGVWGSVDEISERWQVERTFTPEMPAERRDALYAGWKAAVARVRSAP